MDTNTDHIATQLAEGYRRYPIDDHGKLRMAYFDFTAPAGGVAANGTIGGVWLPPGRKRILIDQAVISNSAFGAGRTLDIGHAKYLDRPSGQETSASDDDPDAFADGLDVAGANDGLAFGTALKFDIYSLDAVLVYATVLGGTMPADATLQVRIPYLYE